MDPNSFTSKPRPPYLLGLLCLIPLVGAFVGVGLLLYGIFRYRDKWMILIGLFGIVWTVAVYSALFAGMTSIPLIRSGFRDISRMELTKTVAEIELYKLQHGRYPDSLPQLKALDELAPINDALKTSKMESNTLYNYKNLGDKYYLFSSGLDGIPFNNDDVYPKVDISDSTKIGLIRAMGSAR